MVIPEFKSQGAATLTRNGTVVHAAQAPAAQTDPAPTTEGATRPLSAQAPAAG